MGLFGHLEGTGGRSFKYNFVDVRDKYINILRSEMQCTIENKISDNDYVLSTPFSFRYNMNPGKANVSFSDTGNAICIKINVAINQTAFARISAWIEKGLDLLEKSLIGCKPYEQKGSLADEIKKLKDLLDSGVISNEEFELGKQKLLNK